MYNYLKIFILSILVLLILLVIYMIMDVPNSKIALTIEPIQIKTENSVEKRHLTILPIDILSKLKTASEQSKEAMIPSKDEQSNEVLSSLQKKVQEQIIETSVSPKVFIKKKPLKVVLKKKIIIKKEIKPKKKSIVRKIHEEEKRKIVVNPKNKKPMASKIILKKKTALNKKLTKKLDNAKAIPILLNTKSITSNSRNDIFIGKTFDHEDGVTLADNFDLNNTFLAVGMTHDLNIQVSKDGYLNAWIDYNIDGNFNNTDEKIFKEIFLTKGTHSISINIPAQVDQGIYTSLRFRFSSSIALNSREVTNDGEIEDYLIKFGYDIQNFNTEDHYLADSHYFEPLREIITAEDNAPLSFVKKLGVVSISTNYETSFTIPEKEELAKEGIVNISNASLETNEMKNLNFVDTLGVVEISQDFETINADKHLN